MISNIKKRIGVIILLLLLPGPALFQGLFRGTGVSFKGTAIAAEAGKNEQVSSDTDTIKEAGSRQYVSAGVVLVVWLGIAFFLFRIERRVARLEKDYKDEESI